MNQIKKHQIHSRYLLAAASVCNNRSLGKSKVNVIMDTRPIMFSGTLKVRVCHVFWYVRNDY